MSARNNILIAASIAALVAGSVGVSAWKRGHEPKQGHDAIQDAAWASVKSFMDEINARSPGTRSGDLLSTKADRVRGATHDSNLRWSGPSQFVVRPNQFVFPASPVEGAPILDGGTDVHFVGGIDPVRPFYDGSDYLGPVGIGSGFLGYGPYGSFVPPIHTRPTAPIPEPTTYALALLGVGMMGAALRKRRTITS